VKTMINKLVEIKFDNDVLKLDSTLVAGKEHNGSNISMYIGPLDFDLLHHNLFLINSGVIKILTKELGVSLDNCDEFLLSALTEALVYEWNLHKGKVSNSETSKVVKYRNN
jgi:hypothetical protein